MLDRGFKKRVYARTLVPNNSPSWTLCGGRLCVQNWTLKVSNLGVDSLTKTTSMI